MLPAIALFIYLVKKNRHNNGCGGKEWGSVTAILWNFLTFRVRMEEGIINHVFCVLQSKVMSSKSTQIPRATNGSSKI